MKEIEVKAKITNREALLQNIEQLGCKLSEPILQHDRIFVPKEVVEVPVPNRTNVLRIREQNRKFICTLKQPQTNELDCIEVETEISDPAAMISMIGLLGFKTFSEVKKSRQKCKFNDVEICLDSVEGLGDFIEVEKLADGDSAKIQEDLFLFLESIGVSKADQVFSGYDILLHKKNNSA